MGQNGFEVTTAELRGAAAQIVSVVSEGSVDVGRMEITEESFGHVELPAVFSEFSRALHGAVGMMREVARSAGTSLGDAAQTYDDVDRFSEASFRAFHPGGE